MQNATSSRIVHVRVLSELGSHWNQFSTIGSILPFVLVLDKTTRICRAFWRKYCLLPDALPTDRGGRRGGLGHGDTQLLRRHRLAAPGISHSKRSLSQPAVV